MGALSYCAIIDVDCLDGLSSRVSVTSLAGNSRMRLRQESVHISFDPHHSEHTAITCALKKRIVNNILITVRTIS